MDYKYNGLNKKRAICATLGWPFHMYEKQIWALYAQLGNASEVCLRINMQLARHISITPRSIRRIVKRYAIFSGQEQLIRHRGRPVIGK